MHKNIDFLLAQYNERRRYAVLRGGTGSGKTFASLYFILGYALKAEGKHIHIVGPTYNHLRNGSYKDFKYILSQNSISHKENITNFSIQIKSNIIKFLSVDKPERFRGLRRDLLYVNEANTIQYDKFNELVVRTNEFIILDFNPVGYFWVFDYFSERGENVEDYTCVSTYKDNPFLPESVVREIEARMTNDMWFKAYGLGEWVSADKIFYNYIIDTIDFENAELIGIGCDLGFKVAPTALVGLYRINMHKNDTLYKYAFKELFYMNCDLDYLIKFLKENNYNRYKLIVDAAHKDSIEYLTSKGIAAYASNKLELKLSFDLFNSIPAVIDKSSRNLIKELSNLQWLDAYKNKLSGDKHAIDAARYVFHAFVR